ncbi:MAG: hypothetical protein M1821_002432 [Bathelium mastoideum]|nr:MAG: hypothetical protein M1821_002432 [Bathelium mastoideum]
MFQWTERYDTYRRLNSDIFLLVAPAKNHLYVASPEVISQMVVRRNDFPKPTYLYKSLDLYGKNVVSTEGSIWRHHRKITSPPFTEKNNHMVWAESLHQAQSMLVHWTGPDGNGERTITTIAQDAMTLSLYVISRAGFGVRLEWPHERKGSSEEVPPGHTMSYREALGSTLENLLWCVLLPRWALDNSPFAVHKFTSRALKEWDRYMNEMYTAKRNEVAKGETTEGMDLLGALVRGAGYTEDDSEPGTNPSVDAEKGLSPGARMLSEEEIMGNAFIFILAGHETTANSIHYSLLYLAMHPESQRRLQRDIDEIFGDRPVSEWDYERDCPKLFSNMVGAVMNEQLRLIPPAIGIPKSTPPGQPQSLNFDGRKVVVPGGTAITINTAATHRNPKYWPSVETGSTTSASAATSSERPTSADDGPTGDLEEFRPERWIVDPSKTSSSHSAAEDTSDPDDDSGPSNERLMGSQLYRPPRSAYVPFSEGARSCLGRRFAQVEVVAVLAVLLREHSVELAVDAWASEAEVEAMPQGGAERRRVWGAAQQRARWLLQNGMLTMITIQMRKGKVPLRFVRRGKERFVFGEGEKSG